MKKNVFLTACVLLLAGCTARPSLPYPDAYKEAGLPEYHKAWVTNNGDPAADIIKLRLRTYQSLEESVAHYEKELEANGWVPKDTPYTEVEGFYGRDYLKDGHHFKLSVEEQAEDTSISIIYK